MSYAVDGTNRGWRNVQHQVMPGRPQSRRREEFPGVEQRFSVSGPVMPPALVITGEIHATGNSRNDALTALQNAVLNENALAAGVHTVTIHGKTWTDMEMAPIQTIGRVRAVAASGTVKVKVSVRARWTALSPQS